VAISGLNKKIFRNHVWSPMEEAGREAREMRMQSKAGRYAKVQGLCAHCRADGRKTKAACMLKIATVVTWLCHPCGPAVRPLFGSLP